MKDQDDSQIQFDEEEDDLIVDTANPVIDEFP